MPFSLQINRESARPVYQQIAAQIKDQISVGKLPPGTRLPSVRQLAESLGVNRLTAHNAYMELQADGWIESTVGRGTFVIEQAQPLALLTDISMHNGSEGALINLEPIRQHPTLRSLAYANPDPSLVPTDDIFGMLAGLRREAAALMGYHSPQGDPGLRVALTDLLRERGVEAMPDELMVTAGAIQAMSLITLALARPGDAVLIEQPTYLGLIHILRTYGIRPIPIPMDDDGPDLAAIERALRADQPRFFYTIPTFHNPTGTLMTHSRRVDLLSLAARWRLPIIEDDIYGLLSLDEPAPPALKSLDEHDLVIYISSFSKLITPGLRMGYMAAPPGMQRRLLSLRRAADLCGPAFLQRAVADFVTQGYLKAHLRRVLPIYRLRRDAMLLALDRHMPPGITWTRPGGGLSVWVTLARDNMMAVYHAALARGLAFTPGEAFLIEDGGNRHMRLCFGAQDSEDFDTIIGLLADLIHAQDTYPDDRVTPSLPVYTPMV
jgi:DNA-binding transcriptional MocR family regulator